MKEKYNNSIKQSYRKGSFMRVEHIREILSESIETGRGARAKNLKVYIRFYFKDGEYFDYENRKRISENIQNGYRSHIDGYDFFFDEWEWGVVIYHTSDEYGTKKIESYIKNQPSLRVPWIKKDSFEDLIIDYKKIDGKIKSERVVFEPYNDYSGYGMKVQIRGRKTEEVIGEINDKYAIHPRKVGIEIGEDEDLVNFEMSNTGRISFSRGPVESMLLIITRYVEFIRNVDESFQVKQSRKTIENEVTHRNIGEILTLKLPSLKKIRGTEQERNDAIINMLTGGDGDYGYIGIPIGSDRVNLLDLKNHKALQVTIEGDEVYVYSENPSESRSAIRNFVSKIASYIDPNVEIHTYIPGGG